MVAWPGRKRLSKVSGPGCVRKGCVGASALKQDERIADVGDPGIDVEAGWLDADLQPAEGEVGPCGFEATPGDGWCEQRRGFSRQQINDGWVASRGRGQVRVDPGRPIERVHIGAAGEHHTGQYP